jgi:hypothetical protein
MLSIVDLNTRPRNLGAPMSVEYCRKGVSYPVKLLRIPMNGKLVSVVDEPL